MQLSVSPFLPSYDEVLFVVFATPPFYHASRREPNKPKRRVIIFGSTTRTWSHRRWSPEAPRIVDFIRDETKCRVSLFGSNMRTQSHRRWSPEALFQQPWTLGPTDGVN